MLWNSPNMETQGGFIDARSGAFTPDAASVVVQDTPGGLYRTREQPYLYGTGQSDAIGTGLASTAYDTTAHRWLPVPPQFVAPDGSSYAYSWTQPDSARGVHIVNVESGTDRVVPGTAAPTAINYVVAGFLSDGVYLSAFGGGGPLNGLYRLDPATGGITQVSDDASFFGLFLGRADPSNTAVAKLAVAWWSLAGGDFSAGNDPSAYFEYLTGTQGQHAESWFSRPGFRINVLGADASGRAIVVAESPQSIEVWLLAESRSTNLFTGPNDGRPDLPYKTAVPSAAGWWIGSSSGVWLAGSGRFARVSTTAAVVVGDCVTA